MSYNKDEYNRAYYQDNRDDILKAKRAYLLANRERINARKRDFYARNRQRVLARNREWARRNINAIKKSKADYFQANRERCKEWGRKSAEKLRDDVLGYYSGYKYACMCCGEQERKFLAIDHVDGGGGTERKKYGVKGGVSFYRLLRKTGFPSGYQVLCHNCNMAKGFWGKCPHTSNSSNHNKVCN